MGERIIVRNEVGSVAYTAYLTEPLLGYTLPNWVIGPLADGRWKLERRDLPEPPPEAHDGFTPPDWKMVADALHEALMQTTTEIDQLGEWVAEVTAGEMQVELGEETREQIRAAVDRYDVASMAHNELHPPPPEPEEAQT